MKYFKNTSWLFGRRIIQMAVTLLVGVYVVRYLGPERYGLLSYAMAFVGLFSVIASLGIDQIVVRELVKTPKKRDELLGTAFLLKVMGTIIMGLIIFIGVQFTNNDNFTNLLIAIIATGFLFQAFNVIDLNFQATVQSKYVVYAQIVQLLISSFIKLVLIWLSASLIWFAVVSSGDAVIFATGLIWNYRRKVGKISLWKPRKVIAVSLLKDSWPLILSGMAIMIYMKIDQIMIKEMMGPKEVGYYAAAVKLSEAWYFIPMAITSSLFPAIINAKKSNEKLYYSRLQKLYDLMVWLAVAVALPITFLAPWLIKILYGGNYLPAASVLSIYVWAGVFVFIGVANSKWLISENLQLFSTINTTIGAIINIIINFILIRKIGIEGAAWATLISYFVAAYLSLLFWKKTRISFINISKSFFIIRILYVKKNI